MSNKKARRKKARQGYEPSPPACANCTHYAPPQQGVPAGPHRPVAIPYRGPVCTFGNFTVKARGICDVWQGQDGETLDY